MTRVGRGGLASRRRRSDDPRALRSRSHPTSSHQSDRHDRARRQPDQCEDDGDVAPVVERQYRGVRLASTERPQQRIGEQQARSPTARPHRRRARVANEAAARPGTARRPVTNDAINASCTTSPPRTQVASFAGRSFSHTLFEDAHDGESHHRPTDHQAHPEQRSVPRGGPPRWCRRDPDSCDLDPREPLGLHHTRSIGHDQAHWVPVVEI